MTGESPSPSAKGNLGTFTGVFTPSIMTILGIILFLRLGYVVGNAGLARVLIIIGLANVISILTGISLSAIATNLKVKGGGDYYLISRTLGVEFGGAIGVVLFLAQSVSIAFYCLGFGEAVHSLRPDDTVLSAQVLAAMAVSFLFLLAWMGTDWASRFQYVVMILLGAALWSFFAGGLVSWDGSTLAKNWSAPATGPGFWVLFAIFFPAVTGFTQGVSMSGDLKDAGKSLPLGTFLAVGLSILIYIGVAVVFSGAASRDTLLRDYDAMKRVAHWGFLVDAGVIAATLSSAMASFLGAPRILQSLAGDRIFSILLPFAQGSGPSGNPRRGVLLAAGIAYATIALGKLNVIAPIVSMFFLISYGLLNYATYYEARASSPSFRPRFRWFDLRLSLLGFLVCLGAMLAIDLAAGIVAISVLFAIFQYLKRTAGPARWADSRRSYHIQRVRENLLAAAAEPEHPRDWRPQLLALSDESGRRKQLLRFAQWMQGDSGFVTAVRILEGEGLKMLKLRDEAEKELRSDIAEYDLKAFPLVLIAPSIQQGVQSLVQTFGIGPIKANTILLNWFEHLPGDVLGLRELRYSRNLRTAFRLGCNIVVVNATEDEWRAVESLPAKDRRIDVWWWDDATSRLMLLFAYLMTQNGPWAEAKIRVLGVSKEKEAGKAGEEREAEEDLQRALEEVRIEAEAEVVTQANLETIARESAGAALVFLPFRFSGNQITGPYGGSIEDLVSPLPMVALVVAAEDIDLGAEPEEGKAGEMAAAVDAFEEAQDKARKAAEDAARAADIALEMEQKLDEMTAVARPGADKETMAEIEAAADEVEAVKAQTAKAARRAIKAKAKEEDAAREADALGAKLPEEASQSLENSEPEKADVPEDDTSV